MRIIKAIFMQVIMNEIEPWLLESIQEYNFSIPYIEGQIFHLSKTCGEVSNISIKKHMVWWTLN